jgi:putative cardiolipin synthase
MVRTSRFQRVLLVLSLLAGCASLPPGSGFPKTESFAIPHPEETLLGRQVARVSNGHDVNSGFRLLSVGVDGFLARAQMINAAERTLDLQYYIFREDETGRLLTDAVLRAADRGVRVRILIDDAETIAGDERIIALRAHPRIEIRLFNPFIYRGHARFFRALEFMLNAARLDYRMHNKLFVVDNAIALIGGRNIGDQYFQIDPESQFGDDDVFAAGPIVRQLSATFDQYWNCAIAIPAEALAREKPSAAVLAEYRKALADHREQIKMDGTDYASRIATGEPLAGMLAGKLPLVWAHAQLVYDSPEKKLVAKGQVAGRLLRRPVFDAAAAVQSELLMVTPFLIPGKEGMQLITDLRQRNVRVRILTNSLESTPELVAHSGYMHYRVPLLERGVELYEVRPLLGNARGSGESAQLASYGNYALHAKLFVFDRQKVFIGSMNFDQRSMSLNTEVGLIIDSPELARQTAARFELIVRPANSYALALRESEGGGAPRLVWRTEEDGHLLEFDRERARSARQRLRVKLLSLLPLDKEL